MKKKKNNKNSNVIVHELFRKNQKINSFRADRCCWSLACLSPWVPLIHQILSPPNFILNNRLCFYLILNYLIRFILLLVFQISWISFHHHQNEWLEHICMRCGINLFQAGIKKIMSVYIYVPFWVYNWKVTWNSTQHVFKRFPNF